MNSRALKAIILALVLAFTPLSFAQSNGTESSDSQPAEAGITPDSPFYGVETFWDNVRLSFVTDSEAKARFAAELSDERLAEMEAMVKANQIEFAKRAQEENNNYFEVIRTHVERFDAENTDGMAEMQRKMIEHNKRADELRRELMEKYENGELTEEEAKAIYFDKMKEVASYMDERRSVMIGELSDREGISIIDAELRFRDSEEQYGVTEIQKTESEKRLVYAQEEIQRIIDEHAAAVEAGTVSEDDPTFDAMISQAKLRIQLAQDAYSSGKYGKAFGQFNSGEHIMLNVEKFLNQDRLTPAQKAELESRIQQFKDPEYLKKDFERIEQENQKYAQEYEQHRERILAERPELAEQMSNYYEHSKREAGYAYQFKTNFDLADKMRQEGKSDEEIQKVFAQNFKQEIEVIPIGRFDGRDPASTDLSSGTGRYGSKYEYDPSSGSYKPSQEFFADPTLAQASGYDPNSGKYYEQIGAPEGWKRDSSTGVYTYQGNAQSSETYKQGYQYDPASGKYYPGDFARVGQIGLQPALNPSYNPSTGAYSTQVGAPNGWVRDASSGVYTYAGDKSQGSDSWKDGYTYDPSSGKYQPGDFSRIAPEPIKFTPGSPAPGSQGEYVQPYQTGYDSTTGQTYTYNPNTGSYQYYPSSGSGSTGTASGGYYSGGTYYPSGSGSTYQQPSGSYQQPSGTSGGYYDSSGSYSGGSYSGGTSSGSYSGSYSGGTSSGGSYSGGTTSGGSYSGSSGSGTTSSGSTYSAPSGDSGSTSSSPAPTGQFLRSIAKTWGLW